MDLMYHVSWCYSHDYEQRDDFFEKLKKGINKYPFNTQYEIAKVNSIGTANTPLISILVLRDTLVDDSIDTDNKLSQWFENCDCPSYEDKETKQAMGRSIQEYFSQAYGEYEIIDIINNKVKSQEEIKVIPKEMVAIPAGKFRMGEYKFLGDSHRTVILDAFYMDITLVTQIEYKALMGMNPSHFKGDNKPVESVTWYDAVLYCNARSKQEGKEPVYKYSRIIRDNSGQCIQLTDLIIDFNQNGYRLPTEAEWEYACRAETSTPYYWGTEMNDDYAWYNNNSSSETHPVRMKKPNVWGLYDMIGNVSEWCSDWYVQLYCMCIEKKNPYVSEPFEGSYHALRGGRYNSDYLNCYSYSRWAFYKNRDRSPEVGFRCVRMHK
jgi:formylglycine-generating enzyme required for sulfatase activity